MRSKEPKARLYPQAPVFSSGGSWGSVVVVEDVVDPDVERVPEEVVSVDPSASS